ncbi:hypothetical protein LTS15_006592 [Exophiala xenobiotica]|nr:hypothetical protein LTS15_006592 [Exophiala xenobiotica]
MVLDPVTAFGVAGNVIQFVEFGSNIIGKLEEFTTILDGLNSRLQNYPPSSTVSTGPGWEIGILQASEGCQKVSAKLSKLLEKMKTLRGKRFGAWRQAFSAQIKDKEINTLMRDLEVAKSQLSLNIVAYLSAQRETDLKEVLRVSKSAESTFLEVVRKDYHDLRSQLDLLKAVVHGESSATQRAINEWQSTCETMLAATSAKIGDDTRQSLANNAVGKMLASLYSGRPPDDF